MIRLAKNLVLTLVVALALSALALYYGTQALLEHYKPELVAEISDSVGCPVSYSRATMRLTTGLQVVLHDVAVMGTDLGFEVTSPFLAAEVNLAALVQKHLDFDEILLRSPSITLVTGAPSSQQGTPTSPPSNSPPPPQASQTNPSSLLPGIGAISISSGRIARRDSLGHESVILSDLNIESSLTSQGKSITVQPSTASFKLPTMSTASVPLAVQATLQQLTYSISPRSIAVQGAAISTGTSSIQVSSTIDLSSGAVNASVQGSKVDLSSFQQLIGAKGLTGTSDVQLNVQSTEQSTQVSGTFGLSATRIVAKTGEAYGVTSLTGPLAVVWTRDKGTSISSQALSVKGFSYQDPNVTLAHVNGSLTSITGTIGPDGATTFTTSVHGTGLDLTAGPFTINKIGTVDSPLTIKVPSNGGYSVTGPVKAAGVDMTFHGRPLTGASGSVDMVVSNTVLRFISKSIQTQTAGLPLSVSGTLEITDDAYNMPNLVGQVAGGSLASSITIQRGQKQEVKAEVLAKGLDVASVKSLWTGDTKAAFSGRIDHLSVKATARKSDLLSSAVGEGVIEITDGSVTHARFDRKVVGLIKAIPVVGEAASFTATATDGSTYEMNGGMLKDLTADFTISSGRIKSKNIKAQGKLSNLVASGDISFNGDLNIAASAVYLEQNLKALAGPISPLGSLLGTIGKIEIPLLIRGTVGNPSISADLSRLQDISSPGRAISPIFRGLQSVVDSATGN